MHRGLRCILPAVLVCLLAGTAGDLFGGMGSDFLARRTGNLKISRRSVAVFGFLLAAAAIVPAALTSDPIQCVVYTCLALFGLELTVGVSWAIPLDIGGDYAGSKRCWHELDYLDGQRWTKQREQ